MAKANAMRVPNNMVRMRERLKNGGIKRVMIRPKCTRPPPPALNFFKRTATRSRIRHMFG